MTAWAKSRTRLHSPGQGRGRPAPCGASAVRPSSRRIRKRALAKEELIEFDGVVTELLPEGRFRVRLDNQHEILAYTAGKMKKHRIRSLVGDRVIVEMTPYDLDRGRIIFRQKVEGGGGQRPFRRR